MEQITSDHATAVDESRPPSGNAPTTKTAAGRAIGTTFESLAVAGLAFGVFAIAISVFALGLAARAVSDSSGTEGGSGGGGGPAAATLDMALADFSLDPDDARITADGTITLENVGAVQHNLVIEDVESEPVEPGETSDFALSGLDPGDYEMYCSIPGHREAGMEGVIVLE